MCLADDWVVEQSFSRITGIMGQKLGFGDHKVETLSNTEKDQ
jgi:hypothetical protein